MGPPIESSAVSLISDRIRGIRTRILAAAGRSPHAGNPVTLVAVTKHHPASAVDAVAAAGVLDMGENRIQEALAKAPEVDAAHQATLRWHLIGHLQRNKVNKALTLFHTIHSVDSSRLVDALGGSGRVVEIFLQLNVSGETTKSGASPEDAADLLRATCAWPDLRVAGLMTMAPYAAAPEESRPYFRMLREVRDDLNRRGDAPPMTGLSMGMSGDFEVAVEEGASHVRIGSAILSENAPPSG